MNLWLYLILMTLLLQMTFFGEVIGDKILKEFASKMRNYFDGNEFLLYRIESDKFAVVPKNKMDTKDFFNICKDFLEKVENEPFLIEDRKSVV